MAVAVASHVAASSILSTPGATRASDPVGFTSAKNSRPCAASASRAQDQIPSRACAPSRIMARMDRCADLHGARLHARRRGLLCMTLAACISGAHALKAQAPAASDWGYYGGDAFGQRFSSLDQINRYNVQRLVVAWT